MKSCLLAILFVSFIFVESMANAFSLCDEVAINPINSRTFQRDPFPYIFMGRSDKINTWAIDDLGKVQIFDNSSSNKWPSGLTHKMQNLTHEFTYSDSRGFTTKTILKTNSQGIIQRVEFKNGDESSEVDFTTSQGKCVPLKGVSKKNGEMGSFDLNLCRELKVALDDAKQAHCTCKCETTELSNKVDAILKKYYPDYKNTKNQGKIIRSFAENLLNDALPRAYSELKNCRNDAMKLFANQDSRIMPEEGSENEATK